MKYAHSAYTQSGQKVFKGEDRKFYLKKADRYVRLPKNTKVISIDNYKASQESRGREVAAQDSASYAQFVYGRMRVGGVYSFFDTNANTKAYLVAGDGNKAIRFTAKTAGASGNNTQIRIVSSGTNGSISIGVVGNLITITVKSTGGTPESTRSQVIAAVQAHGTANSMVDVVPVLEDGNGIVQAMSTTNLSYGGGNTLHTYTSLAIHEIDAIEKVYLDDREVTFGSSPDPRWATGSFEGRFFFAPVLGAEDQWAQPDMQAQLPGIWTSDHRQRGIAGDYSIFIYDHNTFAEGFPEKEVLLRGKKCYDPRSGLTVWTQNAALIIADYLTNTKFGMGIDWAKIDTAALEDSADCCDEDVNLAAGGTEKRYTINGLFHCGMTHRQVLEEMVLAMAGHVVYQGGKWLIHAGKWRAPVMQINEDDFRGAIKISLMTSTRDSYNGIKGTYINPDDKYSEAEYPLVKNSTYITNDGRENFLDLNLNLVHSPAVAQRIGRIMLERNAQPIEFAAPMSVRLLYVAVCNVVQVSFEKYGWVNKLFEIRNHDFRHDPITGIGCDVVFRETAEAIYDDTEDEITYDPAPNTTLPSPHTAIAPSNLVLSSGTSELYKRLDGTIVSRLKASWDHTTDIFVLNGGQYQCEYKKTADSTWIILPRIPATQNYLHVLDVQDGQAYDFRVKSVNKIATESSYITSTNHTVVGKTEKPASVTGFAASINNFGIALSWTRNAEVDIAGYRIKRHYSADWNAATLVENLVTATQLENNFRQVGTWYYLIKAVDTSGNESTDATSVAITVAAPLAVAKFDLKVTNNIILIDWEEPTSTSFPVAKYRVYKGPTFATATLLGEAFVTFQTYTEQFAGSNSFWVTAVDTGGNEGPETGKYVTWFNPPNTIQYAYSAIDADDSELAFAVMDETFPNSFIAPVRSGDTWTKHFTENGWDKMLDQMVGYDSDAIKAISGLVAWYSANAEVTETDKKISQINDLSSSGYHATQATDANRPILSRADNQENFLTYSEQQSIAAAWDRTSYPCTVIDNDVANYAGTVTAARITASAGSSRHGVTWTNSGSRLIYIPATGQYIYEVDVAAGTATYVWIGISADSSWHGATLNLSNGTWTGVGSGVTKSVTSLGGGWYRATLTITAVAAHRPDGGVWLSNSSNNSSPPSIAAAGTETFYMTRAQLRRTTADSTYLKSEASYQIAGVNGNRCMAFNGTSQYLSANSLATLLSGSDLPMTIFTVQKSQNNSGNACVLGLGRNSSTTPLHLLRAGSSGSRNGTRRDDASTLASSTHSTSTTNLEIFSYVFNGTDSTLYVNGTLAGTANQAMNVGTTTLDRCSIMARDSGGSISEYTTGFLCELLVFNTALNTTDRQAVEAYLAKYTGAYAPLEPFIGSEEGWLAEFTARGWTTIQDQINAGFEIWIEPSETETAYFSRIVDTGVTIQSARVEATFSETLLDGSCTVETYISTSADLITWTDHAEGTQVLATTFRWVKVEIRIDGADEQSLVRIGDPAINVGVRKATVTGRSVTDSSGNVTVSIGTDFLSLDSIQLTPVGGTGKEVFPVFNYATLNPTSFDVLGYSAGAPAAVDFSYTVIGATGVL